MKILNLTGGGQILFAKQWLLPLTALLLIVGCQKDKDPTNAMLQSDNGKHAPVAPREGFSVTHSWLKTFQGNLAVALDSSSIPQAYPIEQVVAGTEALINIATSTPQLRTLHQPKVTYFQVGTSDSIQAMRDVYNNAYSHYRNYWLSKDTTETYPVAVHIRVDSTSGSTAYIKVVSIVGVSNSCLNQNYTYSGSSVPCMPFDEEEAYRVGGGDEELSLQSFYWNPECEDPCGDTPACEIGGTTAYEQIEERINFNYLANNNPCPSNYTFVGWVNIAGPFYAYPVDEFLREDCPSAYNQTIGTCMEWEDLNCVYCSIYYQIGFEPFAIPSGKQFISINLGLDVCVCGNSICDRIVYWSAEYYFGTPVCKLTTTPPQPWDYPIAIDLDTVSF